MEWEAQRARRPTAGPTCHSASADNRRTALRLAKEAGRVTEHDQRSIGKSCQPGAGETSTSVTQASKLLTTRRALAWCSPAAIASTGSSAIAFRSHNDIVVIVLAALSCVTVIAVCVTAVIDFLNRDTATIDARTRAKILRRWARKASTPEERERAALVALAPITLSGGSRSSSESLKELLPPRTAPGDRVVDSKLGRRSAESRAIRAERQSEHKLSS